MLTTPCHTSSRQMCVAAGCPGPNQRSDLHCHHFSTIRIPLLTWTQNCWTLKFGLKKLFDIESGIQKLLAQKETYCRLISFDSQHCLFHFLFISSLQMQNFLRKENGGDAGNQISFTEKEMLTGSQEGWSTTLIALTFS
uniref:Uncharacterized protein n=1 Tax=Pipistrellus kuhlii TaxID=59472 RepID=A0A7J7XV01_PIPKU|nr:hypothetical protein mPipKuh1_010470 [Pipistrellus kuhlii]